MFNPFLTRKAETLLATLAAQPAADRAVAVNKLLHTPFVPSPELAEPLDYHQQLKALIKRERNI